MDNYILTALKESTEVKEKMVKENLDTIKETVNLIVDTIKSGNKILVCGNGGSAADSLHICGEFTNRLLKERDPLPAIPLVSDASSITAIGNDYSFDEIFSKQVKAFGKKGDLLWGLTTSGNSKNILEAAKVAKEIGMKVMSFSGKDGGKIKDLSDTCLIVSGAKVTPRIQETHSFLYHVIIEMVENIIFEDAQKV